MSRPELVISPEERRVRLEQRLKAGERVVGIPRRHDPLAPAVLSFGQERLWFLAELEPESSAYHVARVFRLDGPVSAERLAAALSGLVSRHETLRTSFRLTPEGPRQEVRPAAELPRGRRAAAVPVVDLAALGEETRQQLRPSLGRAEARRPFQLSRQPALRLVLLAEDGEQWVLLLTAHHIAVDAASFVILYRELSAFYRDPLGSELPPLPVQYADYAVWQRQRLDAAAVERQVQWWREELEGAPRVLELPADRPRPRVASLEGSSVGLPLAPTVVDALRALAAESASTPFALVLAAFAALLGRQTGEADLLLGTAVAERPRRELEPLMGLFLNTLVLRLELQGGPTFGQLASRSREAARRALAHQELPFEKLVEALDLERDLSRSPLVQVMVLWQREELEGLKLPGVVVTPVALAREQAQLDLSLAVVERADGLALHAQYAVDLFDATRISRLLVALSRLLAAGLAEPMRPIATLPLLSPAEEAQLLREWNDREVDGFETSTVETTLVDLVRERAAACPEAVALVDGETRWSYGALGREVMGLAGRLAALGVGPEARVGVSQPRSSELVISLLAVQAAGGAYVPLDPAYPEERLGFMVEDSGTRVVVAGPEERRHLPALAHEVAWVEPGERAELARRARASARNLAYLIYTSGSTGRPKAVAIEHRSAVAMVAWALATFGADELAGVLLATSMAFDLSVFEIFATLAAGGKLIVGENAFSLAELPARYEVTLLNTVPGAASELEHAGAIPASLRTINLAGEPLPGTLAQRLHRLPQGVRLWNLYGPSEDTTYSTAARVAAGPGEPTIGRPLPDTEALVLDGQRESVPLGVPGELFLAGLGLARGYLGRPGLTAERFVPHPRSRRAGARAYRTGDLVRWLPTADLEFLGRLDHQVKIRGFRIELGEIEAALLALPAVAEAVVVARKENGSEAAKLVAYVTGEEVPPDSAAVVAALARHLPQHMVPALVVALEHMPRLPNGKIDRKRLPAPEARLEEATYEPPSSTVELALAEIWAELLKVERVGRNDSFFALGGHSLLAVRLVARLRDRLGVEVPVKALFERPRLAELALGIAGLAPAEAGAPLVPVSREGLLPLSFPQLRLWILDRLTPGSTAANIPLRLDFEGELEVATLSRALAAVEQRHEALRTTFYLPADEGLHGEPAQHIAPFTFRPLAVVDLAALAAPETAAAGLAERHRQHVFDLERGPLFVRSLLRLGRRHHRLLANQHHIVSDGWSIAVWFRELVAGLAGQELPPRRLDYADFAVWQRGRMSGERLAAEVGFWRRELVGAPPLLELPTDRPRGAVQTFRGGKTERTLSPELSRRLVMLAQERSATLFMLHLAALSALLARLSGQDEVMVGTPVAGRGSQELEGLLGCFLNTLVLRMKPAGATSFRALVEQARETALSAFAHGEVPFEKLLDELSVELGIERDLSRTPLFQVLLNVLNFPREEEPVPGLKLALSGHQEVEAKFDLTLYVREVPEQGGAITWSLVYNADLFDAPRMEILLGQLETLLEQAAESPSRSLGAFSLLTPETRAVLPDPRESLSTAFLGTVVDRFVARAEAAPDLPAVIDGEICWTYAELATATHRLAHTLADAGFVPGERVAIVAHRGAPLALAVLAALEAGGVYFILDPAYPAARLVDFVELARPKALLALAAAGSLPAALEEALERVGCTLRFELPATASPPALPPGAETSAATPLALALSADTPAVVGFTSGSTGKPKGILGRHGSLTHFIPWQAARFGLGDRDRFSLLSGLAHDPLQRDLFTPLQLGASIHVPVPERIGEPGYLAGWFAAEGITVAHLTPAMAQLLTTAASNAEPPRLEALRLSFLVGDVLTGRDVAGLRELAPGITVVNHYGSTETQRSVGYHVAGSPAPSEVLPLGRGIEGVQLLVRKGDGGLCAVGELGEIALRSPHLALGYWRDPELSARKFLPAPSAAGGTERLYLTGDLGRYLPNGEVAFAGRADTQVKIRGFRVELGEIEAVLAAFPRVEAVAVLARDGAAGKRLAAYVVAKSELSAEELRQHAARELPDYMVPQAVVFLDRLPLTPNGKLDRRALPEPIWSGVGQGESAAPETPLEVLLAALWAELLGVESVGRQDAFFAVGGHSLLATRLVARLGAELGFDVPLRAVFEFPRLADLAAEIERLGRGTTLTPLLASPSNEPAPLSWAQLRLWILTELEPESAVNNLPARLRLRGELDVAALGWALAEIERRHHGLRSTFARVGEEPRQVVGPAGPAHLPVIDLSGLVGETRLGAAEGLARRAAHQVMRLSLGPLFRRRLLRFGEGEHSLLLNQHHIVADGWSRTVLYRELAALYRARLAGLPSPLAELPLQVADFARWQRRNLEGPALAGKLALLKERLAGAPPLLELPTDRPRGRAPNKRAGHLVHGLSPELSDRLTSFARADGATLFMVQLAAFAALLSRWSGQDDVVIGTPVAGRPLRALEGLIGCFLNTAALRLRPEAGASFRELVAGARRVAVEAYALQDVPFEKVLSELDLERHLDRSPLFQVFLNMLSFEREAPALDGIEVEPEGASEESEARFDLTLYVGERAGTLAWRLLYDAELFDAARMQALAEELEALLVSGMARPDEPLGRLSLVTPRMAKQLPDPAAPLSAASFGAVHELASRQASAAPDRVALVSDEVVVSYAGLERWSDAIAFELAQAGVERGDRVAILAERRPALVACLLAVMKVGGVYAVLDAALPAARLAGFLDLVEPRVLLCMAAGEPSAELSAAAQHAGAVTRFAAVLPTRLDAPKFPAADVGADEPALIAFTSGSTGEPKGILGRHGSLTHFIPWRSSRFELGADDRFSLLSGLAHDPLQRDVFVSLALGASIRVPAAETILAAGGLVRFLSEQAVTVANLTPAMVQLMGVGQPSQPGSLAHLRAAFVVGEALRREEVRLLAELAPGATVVNHYGATESQQALAFKVVEPLEVRERAEVALGRGIEDVQLLVRNGDGGLCAVGELGEIALRSPHLALGYWRDPELSARKFLPAPSAAGGTERLYLTGDLGRYLPNGEVAFAGRADTQVKIRGFRVELGEIEAVLASHPGVEAVAVLARDGAAGKRLAAYVVAKSELSAEELRQHAARDLPDYMVPQAVVFLDRLPLTPNGKLDRRALPEPSWSTAVTPEDQWPGTLLEQQIAVVYCQVLGLERVGRDESFFALGGHSLAAARLVGRLQHSLGVEVPLRLLFEVPSVRGLARVLEGRQPWSGAGQSPLVRGEGPAPASFGQERLWFLEQLEGSGAAYHLPLSFRLTGRLNPAALAAGWASVVARHEALRTGLLESAVGLVQRVSKEPLPAPPWVDLSALGAEHRILIERDLARLAAARPFDLANGPLLRVCLLANGATETVLLVTLHHAAADGWSIGVLFSDFAEFYRAALEHRPARLPVLAGQYGDFARHQRQTLQGEALESLLVLWRQRLAEAPMRLELPTDRPRPAKASHRGAALSLAFDQSLLASLATLGREEGATLFMVLTTALSALLSRHSGQSEVMVGTPIAGRSAAELEAIVGLFANTLVLRLPGGVGLSGHAHLAAVREQTLWAFAHQDLPFEKLVAELVEERDLSLSPLFQVMLGLQNQPRATAALPDLEVAPHAVAHDAVPFDLLWQLVERPAGLVGRLQFNCDLFDASTVRRLAGQWKVLLAGLAVRPGESLATMSLLDAAERQQLVQEWNDTAGSVESSGVGEHLARWARQTPDAVAAEFGEECLSYAALESAVTGLAAELEARGAGPEVLVGIALERGLEMLIAVLAVERAGAAYLPLDPSFPRERLDAMVADSGVGLVIDGSGTESAGRSAGRDARRYDDSLAYVLYTSGSTGRPKGVAVSRGALAAFLAAMVERPGMRRGQRLLAVTTLSFDIAGLELYLPLVVGGTVVIADRETTLDGARLVATVAARRIDLLQATPATWRLMLAAGWEGSPGLAALCGGEALTADLAEELVARVTDRRARRPAATGSLWNLYGPTEATVWATVGRVEASPITIGRPIAGYTGYVVSEAAGPRAGSLAPLGVAGELLLGGVALARGYLGRPALTAERFVPDGLGSAAGARLYRTGDLARRRADGELEVLGRIDSQVKLRGFRIELGEIEAVAGEHPEVKQAVALLRGEGGEARLVLYLVTTSGEAPSDLSAFLGRKLPLYMVPSVVVVLERFPLTPNGKVDRKALPAPDPSQALTSGGTAPETSLEHLVAALWRKFLGMTTVYRESDFFTLGGHSLLAARVAGELREELGVELPLRLLFEHSRLAEQAVAVAALVPTLPGATSPARTTLTRLPAGAVPPASFAQERLWFLRQLADDDTAFHLPGVFRLRGVLLPRVWDEVLGALARRHEVLRARLVAVDGLLCQPLLPSTFPAASWLDLTALAAGDRAASEERLAAAEARARFDLERGPLFRARWVKSGAEEALLLLTLHHTVADGWSLGLVVRDLSELYAAAVEHRAAELPALPVAYGDYAAWQRQVLAGETLLRLVSGWRERLEGAPPLLELPIDRPRSTVAEGVDFGRHGLQVPVRVPAAVVAGLNELARGESATLFMALLAGYGALLSRQSGQPDLVVGTPVANRGLPALEDMVGLFTNMLALRLELDGAASLRELLGRAREMAFWAFAHQEVPFERLVAELAPERDLSHTPIFQTALALQNVPRSEWRLPGLVLERVKSPLEAAQFDLAISLVERQGEVLGVCQADAALFDRTTVLRLVAQFERLLARMAEAPDLRLHEVVLLSREETHQLRAEWNDTAAAQPPTATLPALFARQVAACPEAVAVSCEDEAWGSEQWSYGALWARAERGARMLASAGAGPEARVGIFAPRSVATLEMVLATVLAGAAYVPLDPGYPLDRQLFLLDDAEVCCLATAEALPPALAAGLEERGIARVDWRLAPPAKAAAGPPPSPLPDTLAYVLYTSGSTGRPKGVAVTHRAIIRLVFGGGYAWLGPGEVMLQIAAVPFDASTFEIWGALLTGARLFVQPGLPALHLLGEALERARVSVGFLTAGLFHQMVEEAPGALASFTQLMAGGEALAPAAVEALLAGPHRVLGRALINGYGPTESTTFAATYRMESSLGPVTSVPIGRPIGNTRLLILETRGQAAPIGVPGDLALGGLGLARGYWRRPALTAARFVPDGVSGAEGERLYLTGDRARLLADGRVEFLGRRDFQVKIRGFRIEMGEIEAALTQLPEVGQAVVVAVADAQGVLQRLAAYVTPASGGDAPDPDELKRHLRDRLPPFMVPAAILVLPTLPLNSSGKVDRKRLPPPHLDLSRPDFVAAETPLEKLLAALWQEVLGVTEVGRDDDFFALGGHSLAVTRVFARVRSQLGLTLPLGTFFEHTRLRDMAAALEPFTRAATRETVSADDDEEGGELPATHGQQGMWVFAQLDPSSTALHLPNTLELSGPLEAQRLAHALATVVARHETLRTALVATEGRLVQRRVDVPRPVLPVLDLSASREPRPCHDWARRLAGRPFDLAVGPLARFVLVRQAGERHLLSLTFHHAIADGWSDAVFVDEVSRLYRGEVLPAPVQFREQVRWQARELAGPSRATWLAAARERLAGLPRVLELPTDRPRDLAGGHGSASVPLRLPVELVADLGRLGAAAQATPFMTLLAGFGALLARWTGVPELLVGTPLAGRTRPELERVIGLVMNQVPLAVRAGGNPSFTELLTRTRLEALRAFDQQELPFELLVTELGVERAPGLHPLFQVVFALQNFPPNTWRLPGLECRRLPTERGGTAVDLTFFLTESEGAIEGFVELDAQLFDAATVHRLVGHYQTLLEEVAVFPERRLADLSLLRPAERHQLRVEGSGSWEHAALPVGPEALVVRQARISPERVAVVEPDGARWSYAALAARSGELANRLRAAGAGPEVVVAVLAERRFSTLAALLAVARSGAALLPLEATAPPERTRRILADSGAMILVASASDSARLGEGLPPRLDPEAPWEHASAPGPDFVEPDFPESRLAYVIYTSGSTGQPKGVMVESRSLASFVAAAVHTYNIGPDDRVLQLASFSFDACQEEIWPALSRGATLFLRDADWLGSVAHFLSRVADLGLTLLDLPTAFWHQLVADLEVSPRPLPPSLRLVILGGERAQARPARRWSALGGPATVNTYGPTEATVVATAWWLPQRAWTDSDPREVPIGGPLPGVEAQVVDRGFRLVALGTPGELVLGGAQLARGYLGLPARTAAFFVPDPFARRPGARLYRTGDLVRRLHDGALDYLGRTDRQLKVRGFRVEPKEIEALLATVPGVRQAVVVPWPGESGAVDRLVAYLVTGNAMDPAEPRAFLTGRLPEVMIPAAYVALETLPLTVSGKVDLKALPPPQVGGDEKVREAPETDTEIFVAELWRELLKVDDVGRLDSFFALGGHSLLATQLLSRLERELDLKVPLRLLFDSPRLADFAAGVEALLVAGEEG